MSKETESTKLNQEAIIIIDKIYVELGNQQDVAVFKREETTTVQRLGSQRQHINFISSTNRKEKTKLVKIFLHEHIYAVFLLEPCSPRGYVPQAEMHKHSNRQLSVPYVDTLSSRYPWTGGRGFWAVEHSPQRHRSTLSHRHAGQEISFSQQGYPLFIVLVYAPIQSAQCFVLFFQFICIYFSKQLPSF